MSAGEGIHGALYDEEVILGASFQNRGGWCCAVDLIGDKNPATSTYLCDLTGSSYRLLSGSGSAAVANAALGVPAPLVGRCVGICEPDGSPCFLVRCGDEELVVLSLGSSAAPASTETPLGSSLGAGARLDDATPMLTPLLLMGQEARAVLADYVGALQIPAQGQVAQLKLDAIPAVSARLPVAIEAYLLMVPPQRARVLWRSFLSFKQVTPIGLDAATALLASRGHGDATTEGR